MTRLKFAAFVILALAAVWANVLALAAPVRAHIDITWSIIAAVLTWILVFWACYVACEAVEQGERLARIRDRKNLLEREGFECDKSSEH